MGSEEYFNLYLSLNNSGEDSFLTRIFIDVPKDVHFRIFHVLENSNKDFDPICSLVQRTEDSEEMENEKVIIISSNKLEIKNSCHKIKNNKNFFIHNFYII